MSRFIYWSAFALILPALAACAPTGAYYSDGPTGYGNGYGRGYGYGGGPYRQGYRRHGYDQGYYGQGYGQGNYGQGYYGQGYGQGYYPRPAPSPPSYGGGPIHAPIGQPGWRRENDGAPPRGGFGGAPIGAVPGQGGGANIAAPIARSGPRHEGGGASPHVEANTAAPIVVVPGLAGGAPPRGRVGGGEVGVHPNQPGLGAEH